MTPTDEHLIRDADLLAQLETARGGAFYQIQVDSLVRAQKDRDEVEAKAKARAAELAAMPREQRRRSIVREVFENSTPTIGDVRHIHSILAVCGLPYNRQPADVRRYERRQGQMSLVLTAGELMTPSGVWKPQPLPFGPKARLILMHLCSEAVKQKSPTIEIAETFTAFVRELGFSDDGGKKGAMTAFKEQLNALAGCSINLGAWDGVSAKSKKLSFIEEFELWLSDDPRQRSLWPSKLTFSPAMFESLQRHALPVNIHAVQSFAGSARKLDMYFWLNYRLHNIAQPLHISWQALTEQFGREYARQRDFQKNFALELGHLQEVFPKLPVKLTEHGMSLQPAGPDVLALPKKRSITKK